MPQKAKPKRDADAEEAAIAKNLELQEIWGAEEVAKDHLVEAVPSEAVKIHQNLSRHTFAAQPRSKFSKESTASGVADPLSTTFNHLILTLLNLSLPLLMFIKQFLTLNRFAYSSRTCHPSTLNRKDARPLVGAAEGET